MWQGLLDGALQNGLKLLDRGDAEQGRPFRGAETLRPHQHSRFYGWTHYGVMIPDLPAPQRFFSIMSILGMPGARAFDTDHALKTSPRRNATVVSGTAASQAQHFAGYDMAQDCVLAEDGSHIQFGQDVCITGTYPEYRVQAAYGALELDIALRCTDKVSWFIKSPIYDHLSLLGEYAGELVWQGERQRIAGLCTFEHAACVSPYSLRDKALPPVCKLPLDFFTYQIINLDTRSQLLLVHTTVLGRPLMTAAWLRSLDEYSRSWRDVQFEVLEEQSEPARAPDGVLMWLPRVFRWRVKDQGREWLDITGTVDTAMSYGLGSGYVGGYHYEGRWQGRAISGLGYIEYIDRRGR